MNFTVVGGQLAHLTKLRCFIRKQAKNDKQTKHYQKIVTEQSNDLQQTGVSLRAELHVQLVIFFFNCILSCEVIVVSLIQNVEGLCSVFKQCILALLHGSVRHNTQPRLQCRV